MWVWRQSGGLPSRDLAGRAGCCPYVVSWDCTECEAAGERVGDQGEWSGFVIRADVQPSAL